MLEGGCLCGGVRYRVTGKLGPAGYCHYKQCQRASGSAFAAPWHEISDSLPQYAEGLPPDTLPG
jgi:hypothetical protein